MKGRTLVSSYNKAGMWPGFDSQSQLHMWVEFVGSLLCTERFFSGYSGFLVMSPISAPVLVDWTLQ